MPEGWIRNKIIVVETLMTSYLLALPWTVCLGESRTSVVLPSITLQLYAPRWGRAGVKKVLERKTVCRILGQKLHLVSIALPSLIRIRNQVVMSGESINPEQHRGETSQEVLPTGLIVIPHHSKVPVVEEVSRRLEYLGESEAFLLRGDEEEARPLVTLNDDVAIRLASRLDVDHCMVRVVHHLVGLKEEASLQDATQEG